MKIEAAKLKSYVDRIERVLGEIDDLKGDVRDIYEEAKGAHVVPKILRKVIARRRAKDQAALLLEDDLLDTYLAALDGPTKRAVELAASGATAREIEQETGIDQATVARSVSLKKKRETSAALKRLQRLGQEIDEETGEVITETTAADPSSLPEGAHCAADDRKALPGTNSDDLTPPDFLKRPLPARLVSQ